MFDAWEIELRETRLQKVERLARSLSPRSTRVLDVGCGDGTITARFGHPDCTVVGLDAFQDNAKAASNKGLRGLVADVAADLPFHNNQFDLILAGEIIEHLVDTGRFLSELHRVLKPGGHLILTTPNLASFENRIRLLLGIYPIWCNYSIQHGPHVRMYTPSTLRTQLNDHGFEPLTLLGNWVPFVPQRFASDVTHPWLAITGDWFPHLAMDMIVLARKRDYGSA